MKGNFVRSSISGRIFIFLLFSFALLAVAEEFQPTIPVINNFTPEHYDASLQNWVAVQDRRGILYFGNTSGILEYDGHHFELIRTPAEGVVRALGLGHDGIIYYGAVGDIGYLKIDEYGTTSAVSLLPYIPENERDFNDVWQIEVIESGVYFLTRSKIFRWHNNRIEVLHGRMTSSQACTLNNLIFYADIDNGLCFIKENQITPLPASRFISNSPMRLAPYGQHQLLIGLLSGQFYIIDLSKFWDENKALYIVPESLDGIEQKNVIKRLLTEADSFITPQNGFLYKIQRLDDNLFALATLKKGIAFITAGGKLLRTISKDDGLADDTVAYIFKDRENNIWCCTNSGISQLLSSSNQYYFSEKNGIKGVSICFHKRGEKIYVGAFTGLYVTELNKISAADFLAGHKEIFQTVKNSPTEIWQFLEVGNLLLAATSSGLYLIKDSEMVRQEGPIDSAYCLGKSLISDDYLFMGLMGGFHVYKRSGKSFKFYKNIEEINGNVRKIISDPDGDLWVSTENKGIYLIEFQNRNPEKYSVYKLNEKNGLPGEIGLTAVYDRGSIYLLTPRGIYFSPFVPGQDKRNIRFQPEETFGKFFNDPPTTIFYLVPDQKGGFIISTDKKIYWVKKNESGQWEYDPKPFTNLRPPTSEPYLDGEGHVWISGNLHYRIDLISRSSSKFEYQTIIKKILAKRNPLPIHASSSSPSLPLKIPYKNNSLRFEYTAAIFGNPHLTRYQYWLEGFDDTWSTWSVENFKEYTNLREGKYRFRVRAINSLDQVSQEAIFSFIIMPPWYRTPYAYILWLLSAVGFIFLVTWVYSSNLRRQKMVLEKLVEEKTRQLKELTLTDPLTGLRNRRYIQEILSSDIQGFLNQKKHMVRSGNRRQEFSPDLVYGLFMIDLDHFKKINDTYGHDSGDLLLKQFAQILKSSVRSDDAVIRMGGEEFIVILRKTRPEYLHRYAAKIMNLINNHQFYLMTKPIKVTCSIGYTYYPLSNDNPEIISFDQVIIIADEALYLAKRSGRNQAVYIQTDESTGKLPEELLAGDFSFQKLFDAGYLKVGRVIKP